MNKLKNNVLIVLCLFSLFVFSYTVKADDGDSVNIPVIASATVGEKFNVSIPYKLSSNSTLQINWSNLVCDKSIPQTVLGSSNPSGSVILNCSGMNAGTAEINAYFNGSSNCPSGSNCKQTITIKPAPTTTTTTTTTKPTSTTTVYDKTKDASLKSLKLTDADGNNVSFTPTFSSNTYSYTANVDGKIDKVNVNAVSAQDKAKVSGSGVSYDLSVGSNTKVIVNVTAEDGVTKKTYTISVYRESLGTDNTLKSLVIKEASDLNFVKNKYEYKITVSSDVKKLTIKATPSSEDSKITIEDSEKTKDGSVVKIKDGSVVKITVLAPDGSKKEYKVTVNVKKVTTTKNVTHIKAQKNPLIIMGLSLIAFGLIGGILYVIKK